MRKKNLLVICAASGLCLIFALILIGSMSIYAEKSGTQEFEPEADVNGASDMLTKLIEEEADATGSTQDAEGTGSAEEAAGAAQEENATDTAANGASGAAAETSAQEEAAKAGAKEAEAQKRTEEADAQKRTEEEAAKASAEEAAKAGAEEAAKASAEAAAKDGAEEGLKDIWKEMYQAYGGVQTDTAASLNGISVNDAGLTLLKEIQHLYPKDSLADLKIKDIYLESMTDSADVSWCSPAPGPAWRRPPGLAIWRAGRAGWPWSAPAPPSTSPPWLGDSPGPCRAVRASAPCASPPPTM